MKSAILPSACPCFTLGTLGRAKMQNKHSEHINHHLIDIDSNHIKSLVSYLSFVYKSIEPYDGAFEELLVTMVCELRLKYEQDDPSSIEDVAKDFANEDFASGRHSSIRFGLEKASAKDSGVLDLLMMVIIMMALASLDRFRGTETSARLIGNANRIAGKISTLGIVFNTLPDFFEIVKNKALKEKAAKGGKAAAENQHGHEKKRFFAMLDKMPNVAKNASKATTAIYEATMKGKVEPFGVEYETLLKWARAYVKDKKSGSTD